MTDTLVMTEDGLLAEMTFSALIELIGGQLA